MIKFYEIYEKLLKNEIEGIKEVPFDIHDNEYKDYQKCFKINKDIIKAFRGEIYLSSNWTKEDFDEMQVLYLKSEPMKIISQVNELVKKLQFLNTKHIVHPDNLVSMGKKTMALYDKKTKTLTPTEKEESYLSARSKSKLLALILGDFLNLLTNNFDDREWKCTFSYNINRQPSNLLIFLIELSHNEKKLRLYFELKDVDVNNIYNKITQWLETRKPNKKYNTTFNAKKFEIASKELSKELSELVGFYWFDVSNFTKAMSKTRLIIEDENDKQWEDNFDDDEEDGSNIADDDDEERY